MNRKEKKNKKRGLITFLILVVLVVLGVLAVYYQYMKKLQLQDTVHTPTTETENWLQKIWMPDIRKLRKRLLNCLEESTSVFIIKNYLTMTFQRLLENSVCFTVKVFRKKIHRIRWKVRFRQRRKNILRKNARLLITA